MIGRRWVIALGVAIVLVAVGAVGLFLVTSDLQAQADAYYSSIYGDAADGPSQVEIDPVKDAYYSDLVTVALNIGVAANALVLTTVLGLFLLLALLAARRDATSQADATAAS